MLINVLGALMFWLFVIVLLPLITLGLIGYTLRLKLKNRGISGTAYEPFFGRLLFHYAGTRNDPAAVKLAPHLPATSSNIVWLLVETIGLASKLSGYQGSFLSYPGARPSSSATLLSHRTTFFDEALENAIDPQGAHPAQQVVFLGAGWDTRAYGSLADRPVRVFEVDTPATQGAKKQALRRAGISTNHVTFVATNFGQTSWFEALLAQGFKPALPTFILWEGVTMYLDSETVHTTLRTVAGLAANTQVAFDTFSREFVQAESPFMLFGRCMQFALKYYYDEHLLFGISTRTPAREQVEKLLSSQGLDLKAFELMGEERGAKIPLGGFTLAACSN